MADIPPINNIAGQYGLPQQPKLKKRGNARTTLGSETIETTADFDFIQAQVDKLLNMPDIRPEMLQLGKKLAKSNDFPTEANVEKLAEALLSPIDDLEDETEIESQ
jgi:hypothetical protein